MAFLYVKAFYGPCDTFGNKIHKPQLLRGLRDRLQKLGFRIDLVPVPYNNYCMLEVCGHEVFQCNLKHLKFNTCYERDVVAQRAVEAVMKSSVKFRRARGCLWFWSLLEHELWLRSKYAPIKHWVSDIEGQPLADRLDCVNCCKIVVTRQGHGAE